MKKILSVIVMVLLLSTMAYSQSQTKCDSLCWTSRFVYGTGSLADIYTTRKLIDKFPGQYQELNPLLRDRNDNVSVLKSTLLNAGVFVSLEVVSKKHRKLGRGLMIGAGAAHFVIAAINYGRMK